MDGGCSSSSVEVSADNDVRGGAKATGMSGSGCLGFDARHARGTGKGSWQDPCFGCDRGLVVLLVWCNRAISGDDLNRMY